MTIPNGTEYIGSNAFTGNPNSWSRVPKEVTIPDSVTYIAEDAFDRGETTLVVNSGSYAEQYAYENGFLTDGSDEVDTSWLNE